MIITLNELKSYLSITDTTQDTLLSLFASGASDYIENLCGRKFKLQSYTEYRDGLGELDLVLDQFPVKTITSIKYNTGTYAVPVWTTLDPIHYNFNKKNGIISLTSALPRGFQNIEIIYEAGYDSIPNDLKLATLGIAGMQYNTRNSNGLRSESVGGDSVTFSDGAIPGNILSIISKYQNV